MTACLWTAVIAAACFVAIGIPVEAQESSARLVDVGAGLGEVSETAGTLAGEFRFQEDHQLITLRVLYSAQFELPILSRLPSPKEHIINLAVLYGRTFRFTLPMKLFPFFPLSMFAWERTEYSASASVGIGGSSNLLRGDLVSGDMGPLGPAVYKERRSFSFGIPLQIEIVQFLSPTVGYVHRLHYDVNGERRFWGLLWGLQFNLSK